MYYANVSVSLMVANLTQTKSGNACEKGCIWYPSTCSCKNV